MGEDSEGGFWLSEEGNDYGKNKKQKTDHCIELLWEKQSSEKGKQKQDKTSSKRFQNYSRMLLVMKLIDQVSRAG